MLLLKESPKIVPSNKARSLTRGDKNRRISNVNFEIIISIIQMNRFEIIGGKRLHGEIVPQGAKNEALQILCAVLLTDFSDWTYPNVNLDLISFALSLLFAYSSFK